MLLPQLANIVIEYIGIDIKLKYRIDLYEDNMDKLDPIDLSGNIGINESFLEKYFIN